MEKWYVTNKVVIRAFFVMSIKDCLASNAVVDQREEALVCTPPTKWIKFSWGFQIFYKLYRVGASF